MRIGTGPLSISPPGPCGWDFVCQAKLMSLSSTRQRLTWEVRRPQDCKRKYCFFSCRSTSCTFLTDAACSAYFFSFIKPVKTARSRLLTANLNVGVPLRLGFFSKSLKICIIYNIILIFCCKICGSASQPLMLFVTCPHGRVSKKNVRFWMLSTVPTEFKSKYQILVFQGNFKSISLV